MVKKYNNIIIKTFTDHKNSPAIISPNKQLSYNGLDRLITLTTERLRDFQIQKDEPVALYLTNSPEYIILLHALWRFGAIAVPVSTRWPGELTVKSLFSIPCYKIISFEKSIAPGEKQLKILHPAQLVSRDQKKNNSDSGIIQFDPERAATIIFTSGSSGEPKAVLHNFANHYYNALGSHANIPFTAGDRWLLTLPLYHVGGLSIVFRSLICGGTVVIPDVQKSLPEHIFDHKITHISLVPTQLYRMLSDTITLNKLKSLKAVLLGGGAAPERLIKKAIDADLPVFTSYGSTEMASQITTTRPRDPFDRLKTSGRILPYRDLKIGPGSEIQVKGKTLCPGYIHGNKITRPVDADGWYATGDLGYMDKNGYLTVTGRKDNMFISGGENIQPEEIENQLDNFPGIEQSLVVPVDNVEFGQRPVAFIKSVNEIPDTEQIKRHLKKYLPKFKIPDLFLPWPDEKRPGIKPDRNFFAGLAQDLSKTHKRG